MYPRNIYRLFPNFKFLKITDPLAIGTRGPNWSNTLDWIKDNNNQIKDNSYSFLDRLLNNNDNIYSINALNRIEFIQSCINLETTYSNKYDIMYHGTSDLHTILVRTHHYNLLNSGNYFLLRDHTQIKNINCTNAYDYITSQIKKHSDNLDFLEKLDHNKPIKTHLLATVDNLLQNYVKNVDANEDPLSYLLNIYVRSNESHYDRCVTNNSIESQKNCFGYTIPGIIAFLIPKAYRHLTYSSLPFGYPIGINVIKDLYDSRVGVIPHIEEDDIHKLLELHKFNEFYHSPFPQQRVLLHPDYFHNPNSGIKMVMYLKATDESIKEITNKLVQ